MNKKEIVAEAVKRAQKIAQEKGLIPSKNVAHPDDEIVYGLISVKGNVATVGLTAKQSPTGKEVRKQFPLNELFNPWTARELVSQIMQEEVNKELPLGNGILVVDL